MTEGMGDAKRGLPESYDGARVLEASGRPMAKRVDISRTRVSRGYSYVVLYCIVFAAHAEVTTKA